MGTRAKLLIGASVCSACALLGLWFALRAEAPSASSGSVAIEAGAPATSVPRTPAALAAETTEEPSVPQPEVRVAQVAEIRGRLVDATTGLPLPGRTIELRARRKQSDTLANFRPDPSSFTAQIRAPVLTANADGSVVVSGHGAELRLGETFLPWRQERVTMFTHGLRGEEVEKPAGGADQTAPAAPIELVELPTVELSEPSTEVELVDSAGNFPVEIAQGQSIAPALGGEWSTGPGHEEAMAELMRQRTRDFAAPRFVEFSVQKLVLDGQILPSTNIRLHLWTGEGAGYSRWDSLGTTTTDAQGRFRFDCPEEPDIELVLHPLDADWIEDETWTFREPGSACATEIEWRVDIAPGSRVMGRVLDARSGAPLDALTVELRGTRDWIETVTTDPEGRFTSSTIFPAGHVEWTIHDGSEERRIAVVPREIELAPAAADAQELVIVATMGPTYRFRFVLEEFEYAQSKRIQVLQEHDGSGMELRIVGAEPWPGWEGSGNPFAEWEPVRPIEEERPAFVRYPVAPKVPRGGTAAEFRSSDGAWCGSARPAEGAEPVEVVLHRTVRAEVRAKLPEDAASSAWSVRATRAAGSGSLGAYDVVPCDEDGSAVLEHLDHEVVRALELLRDGAVVRTLLVRLAPDEAHAFDL